MKDYYYITAWKQSDLDYKGYYNVFSCLAMTPENLLVFDSCEKAIEAKEELMLRYKKEYVFNITRL